MLVAGKNSKMHWRDFEQASFGLAVRSCAEEIVQARDILLEDTAVHSRETLFIHIVELLLKCIAQLLKKGHRQLFCARASGLVEQL